MTNFRILIRIASVVLRFHMRNSLAIEIVNGSGLNSRIARPPRVASGESVAYRSLERRARGSFSPCPASGPAFMLDASGSRNTSVRFSASQGIIGGAMFTAYLIVTPETMLRMSSRRMHFARYSGRHRLAGRTSPPHDTPLASSKPRGPSAAGRHWPAVDRHGCRNRPGSVLCRGHHHPSAARVPRSDMAAVFLSMAVARWCCGWPRRKRQVRVATTCDYLRQGVLRGGGGR